MDTQSQRRLAKTVGGLIAGMRAEAGLTQEEVAEKLGIGNEAVSRMERGAVMPTLTRLFEFADLFRCRVDELLMAASGRDADQAAAIALQIEKLHPRDREFIAGVVSQFAEHLRKRPTRQARS